MSNFDPIPRLQQIAATIRERGADTFDAPATAAYYIDCAIKEIERLRRDYSCICNEMLRMMEERDEARRSCCEFAAMVDSADTVVMYVDSNRFHEIAMRYMKSRGWDCFKDNA
jgi:hypothetical protein